MPQSVMPMSPFVEKPPEDHSLELIENDLDSALEGVKSRSAEAIGAPQVCCLAKFQP